MADSTDITDPMIVTTDQPDYAPGSTAVITASNLDVGGSVTFEVDHVLADGTLSNDLSGTGITWTIVDGGASDLDGIANGIIVTSWNVGLDAAYQTLLLSGINLTTGATATEVFTDAPTPPVKPSDFGYPATHVDLTTADTTDSTTGLTLANSGTALAVALSSTGTGQFSTFLEVQNSPAENGFNSSDNFELDSKNSNNFNHVVSLSTLVEVDNAGTPTPGGGFYVFRLDIHEANSAPYLSLDGLQLWQSGNSNLTHNEVATGGAIGANDTQGSAPNFAFTGGLATKVYDLNDSDLNPLTLQTPTSILLNSQLTSGSGGHTDDLIVLVPTSTFDANLGDNIYLWSAFGFQGIAGDANGHWDSDATFEEWGALVNTTNGGGGNPPGASISLTKDTVCPTDGDSVAGGTLLANNAVEWTYAVTNTGAVDLHNIVVTDDGGDGLYGTGDDPTVSAVIDGSGFNIGDVNQDGLLNSSEVWKFTATGTTIDGAYSNDAHVASDAVGFDPTNPPADLHPFDDASSSYTGVTVTAGSVTVDKEVSVDGGKTWLPADSATGPTLLSGYADPQYKIVIHNTSDADLTGIVVHDVGFDLNGALAGNDLTIDLAADNGASGGADEYTIILQSPDVTWASGQQSNTASISGSFSDDCDNSVNLAASDSAYYFGAAPNITIAKNIICPDDGDTLSADTSVSLVKGNGTVQYEIIVTNTGNEALTPVVTDDTLTLGAPVEAGGLGDHTNGILDVGETWTYDVTDTWAAGTHTNTADAAASFTDSAGNTWSLDPHNSATYFGADPEVKVVKTTTGYTDATHQATGDGLSFLAGYGVTWNYTVTTDTGDNVPLSHVTLKDDKLGTLFDSSLANTQGYDSTGLKNGVTFSGDNGDGILQQGETWVFHASGTAGVGAYSNTATATGSFTDDCGETGTDTATDGSSYTGLFVESGYAWTKGFWGQHLTDWDGIANNDPKAASLIASKVLANKPDVLPNGGFDGDITNPANPNYHKVGVLLGDENANGQTDSGEDTLFVTLTAAQKLISSSDSANDTRQILLSQAIAAQLNIDNGAGQPVDLIQEAVMWLKGESPYVYPAIGSTHASTGNIDSNHNGILDVGTEVNTSTGALLADADLTQSGTQVLTSSQQAWQKFVDVASGAANWGTVANPGEADGEGLKNALMWFNDGHLVTSVGGFFVAWDADGAGGSTSVAFVNPNTTDEFWLTLHQAEAAVPGDQFVGIS